MKTKELKNLAKKIAQFERIIQTSEDPNAVKQAESEIMKLCGSVHSLDDMVKIDEYVQDILDEEKN